MGGSGTGRGEEQDFLVRTTWSNIWSIYVQSHVTDMVKFCSRFFANRCNFLFGNLVRFCVRNEATGAGTVCDCFDFGIHTVSNPTVSDSFVFGPFASWLSPEPLKTSVWTRCNVGRQSASTCAPYARKGAVSSPGSVVGTLHCAPSLCFREHVTRLSEKEKDLVFSA